MIPAASGADAEVPVCLSVHTLCRSVVTCIQVNETKANMNYPRYLIENWSVSSLRICCFRFLWLVKLGTVWDKQPVKQFFFYSKTSTAPFNALYLKLKNNLQFSFHHEPRCWRSWLESKSSFLSTRVIHHDLRLNWWTVCRYCPCIRHSYNCPRVCHHYLTPRQISNPGHHDPICCEKEKRKRNRDIIICFAFCPMQNHIELASPKPRLLKA